MFFYDPLNDMKNTVNENDRRTVARFIGRHFKKENVKQCSSYEDKLKKMQKEIPELKFKLAAKEESKPLQISNSLWNCESFNQKINVKVIEKIQEKYQKIYQTVIFLDEKKRIK